MNNQSPSLAQYGAGTDLGPTGPITVTGIVDTAFLFLLLCTTMF